MLPASPDLQCLRQIGLIVVVSSHTNVVVSSKQWIALITEDTSVVVLLHELEVGLLVLLVLAELLVLLSALFIGHQSSPLSALLFLEFSLALFSVAFESTKFSLPPQSVGSFRIVVLIVRQFCVTSENVCLFDIFSDSLGFDYDLLVLLFDALLDSFFFELGLEFFLEFLLLHVAVFLPDENRPFDCIDDFFTFRVAVFV